ncbi:ATP-binding protein [Spiribacter pallidus]|uniref:ATP-binding protein n=1 Tax=Spiribacter pallidus TaxID=1987936 RepID=UPI0038B2A419
MMPSCHLRSNLCSSGGGHFTYAKRFKELSRIRVLVLDDYGLAVLESDERRELLEILEDRYQRRSTIVTSQLPVSQWHEAIGDPTFADAILERLIHNAYRVDLKGESMRKRLEKETVD